MNKRTCKFCIKDWKRLLGRAKYLSIRAEMRATGRKQREYYPEWVRHDLEGRLCPSHIAQIAQARRRKG